MNRLLKKSLCRTDFRVLGAFAAASVVAVRLQRDSRLVSANIKGKS
jgi:hypothetical protein